MPSGMLRHHSLPPALPCCPCLLQRLRQEMKRAIDEAVEERLLEALLGPAADDTRETFRTLLR